MKNRVKMTRYAAVLLALALIAAVPALAQEAAQAPAQSGAEGVMIEEKVGFLNFQQTLQATNEVKQAIAEVQKWVDEKNQESTQKIEAINSLQEEISAKARSLNSETLAEMRDRLEKMRTDLKRFQEDTQNEINRRREELFRTYGPKLQTVINEYAQANGFSAVFLTDQQNFGYINPQWDLTAAVAEAYNQKHPAAAPDAAASDDSSNGGNQ
ncbi:MAG TPA: OmpH family outer membrane protein [Acidobacteriota bacterium]|nr:OmpH family outer membrane protein [Acidobacteriota bacterium]